ncbi:MAG TPA: hypothetical protein DCK98_01475 [Chloroflexi bacterium]|jgi:molybdopterin/thiamine biosynthesis adenylyltransferase|nr:hypothetical protein [Chloroflexota bacterium]HAL25822.1 hypothetical protein [Chloroflexota bacterium]
MDSTTKGKSATRPKGTRTRARLTSSAHAKSGKEKIGDARQEEDGREGQVEGSAGSRASAQGRRGRRRQERLAQLIAPWWARDPESLKVAFSNLAVSGFRVLGQRSQRGRLVLEVQRGEDRYELEYDEDLTSPRATVTAYALSGQLQIRIGPVARAHQPDAAAMALEQLAQGLGQYDLGPHPEYVLVPVSWHLPGEGDRGSLSLGRSRHGTLAAIRVTNLSAAPVMSEAGVAFARAFPDLVLGLWARGSAPIPEHRPAEAVLSWAEEQIARAHRLEIGELRERLRHEVGAIVVQRPARISADWYFVRRSSSGAPIVLLTREYQPQGFADRAPFAAALAGKRVLIIGCGAVGWPVATLLARSGVRNFALFDDDALSGGNLARVGGFLESTGRLKVDVLAEQLEAIAPNVVVARHPVEVGLHVGAQALVAARPDLLINLTAEEFSTDETNAAACFLNQPAVFGWVSNNVRAARLFRVRPLETACYECVRQAGPERIPSDGLVPVGTETPWSGSVIDVDLFAAAVAKMAVATLLGEPTSATNPDHVVLRYGGLVPVASRITIARDPHCRVCRP